MCRNIAASLAYRARASLVSALSRRADAVSERAKRDDINISNLGTLPNAGSNDRSGDNEKGSGPRPMLEDIRFYSTEPLYAPITLPLARSEHGSSQETETALVQQPV